MADPAFISFLSDYGTTDEFVGVCKAVMWSIAPEARIIDVTHNLPPHDVRAGALALVRSVQYLPEGIVVAIVDPGVGTDRAAVAIEVEHGVILGPDNGLLAPAVSMMGGAQRVVSLTNAEYHIEAPGPTFAGRDVFAPAAAHLAAGVALDELGEALAATALTPGLVSLPRRDRGGALLGEVWWIDRFGNCQLNIDPDELAATGATVGDSIEVRMRDTTRAARWVNTYADAKPSELVLLVDSYGLMSLAMDRRSAANEWKLSAGAGVTLVAPGTEVTGEVEGP
ncbi:MAG: SAM hydrolase/SAM-dependent halogenase family protein [Acidimicrobiia bacterium]